MIHVPVVPFIFGYNPLFFFVGPNFNCIFIACSNTNKYEWLVLKSSKHSQVKSGWICRRKPQQSKRTKMNKWQFLRQWRHQKSCKQSCPVYYLGPKYRHFKRSLVNYKWSTKQWANIWHENHQVKVMQSTAVLKFLRSSKQARRNEPALHLKYNWHL